MTMEIIFVGAVLLTGLSALFWVLFFSAAAPEVEEEERSYMDPLPPLLKLLWPLITLIVNTLVQLFPNRYLDQVEEQLQKTGVGYLLTAEEFVALRFTATIIAFSLALLIVAAIELPQALLFLTLAPLGGFLFPMVWLSDTRKRREKAVIRALPIYLDFTTMAVEAGLNLSGALQQAMQKCPEGPLRNEFAIMMRDLRAGVARSEALKRMAERLDIADVTSFVNAMVQAERMGSSMAATLRIQSEQRRNERFQRAEKQAMQAPVKLIFPLIIFIFPVTFIVLGFPIMMKFMNM